MQLPFIAIRGNLGRDAELKHTPQGKAVCKFSVASKTGNKENPITTWWNITLWEKYGETMAPLLTKGKSVIIFGTPSVRAWEKDGKSGYSPEITCTQVILLGQSDRQARPGFNNEPENDPYKESEKSEPGPGSLSDSEVPF